MNKSQDIYLYEEDVKHNTDIGYIGVLILLRTQTHGVGHKIIKIYTTLLGNLAEWLWRRFQVL